ncbi:MAG TPA: hypothetical protein VLN44_07115, partial [Pyrinomonadaceae bacterium]|nr:hypothetical protein [Pyrinomonadaceae bacterium]
QAWAEGLNAIGVMNEMLMSQVCHYPIKAGICAGNTNIVASATAETPTQSSLTRRHQARLFNPGLQRPG